MTQHRGPKPRKKPDPNKFVFTNQPQIPTHPHLQEHILHYTPLEWKERCWRKIPPECAECGINFVRPDSGVQYFCTSACEARWQDRLRNKWIPTKYRKLDWPGKSEGELPEEIAWVREIWNTARDDARSTPLAAICGANCYGHPTNEEPLKPDRRGKPCRLPAGWGTNHIGTGRCRYHFGNAPTHTKKAARERAQEMRIVEERIYGSPVANITPEEAILQELARTAGHVEWLYQKVQQVGAGENTTEDGPAENKALIQYTKLGITPSVWIQMYQEERKHLMSVAKTASAMGIAERQVQIAEQQGKLLAMVIQNFMNDPLLALTPQQRVNAPELIRKHLAAIPLSTTPATAPGSHASGIVQPNGLTAETNQFVADQEAPDDDEILEAELIDQEEG